MKICLNCNEPKEEMYGSGIYCSRSCAASFPLKGKKHSKEIIQKRVAKNRLLDIERYGELKEYQKNCYLCSCEFFVKEKEFKHPEKEKYFCSRSCANNRGPRGEETKKKIRDSLLNTPVVKKCMVCDEEFSVAYSQRKYNRCRVCIVKRNSPKSPVITKKCDECGSLCPNNRKYCSSTCRNLCRRLKRDQKIYNDYRALCKFVFHLGDFPDEFDFSLLKEHGMYKYKVKHGEEKNTSGVSRDHIVSVSFGFKNNIDPALISHPANCRLMIHSENSKKRDKCDMTIEQLIERITKWDEKYSMLL